MQRQKEKLTATPSPNQHKAFCKRLLKNCCFLNTIFGYRIAYTIPKAVERSNTATYKVIRTTAINYFVAKNFLGERTKFFKKKIQFGDRQIVLHPGLEFFSTALPTPESKTVSYSASCIFYAFKLHKVEMNLFIKINSLITIFSFFGSKATSLNLYYLPILIFPSTKCTLLEEGLSGSLHLHFWFFTLKVIHIAEAYFLQNLVTFECKTRICCIIASLNLG